MVDTVNLRWFKIDSWHISSYSITFDNGDVKAHSLCGLTVDGKVELLDERPGNEATCENCLRIVTNA